MKKYLLTAALLCFAGNAYAEAPTAAPQAQTPAIVSAAAAPTAMVPPTAAPVSAAQAPAAAPAPAAPAGAMTAASPASANQQNRMKVCAAEYHQQNIPKSQYRSFMSTCLKSKKDGAAEATQASAPPTPVPAGSDVSGVKKASASSESATQQDKMKSCNADAKKQSLKGDARKTFMRSCLSN